MLELWLSLGRSEKGLGENKTLYWRTCAQSLRLRGWIEVADGGQCGFGDVTCAKRQLRGEGVGGRGEGVEKKVALHFKC